MMMQETQQRKGLRVQRAPPQTWHHRQKVPHLSHAALMQGRLRPKLRRLVGKETLR